MKLKAAAEEAVNALTRMHSLAGIDSPAANLLVQATLQGLNTAGTEEEANHT